MDGAPKVEFKADKAVLQKGFIGGAVASILMLIAGWIGSLLFASMLSEMFSKFAKELEMLPSFLFECNFYDVKLPFTWFYS